MSLEALGLTPDVVDAFNASQEKFQAVCTGQGPDSVSWRRSASGERREIVRHAGDVAFSIQRAPRL